MGISRYAYHLNYSILIFFKKVKSVVASVALKYKATPNSCVYLKCHLGLDSNMYFCIKISATIHYYIVSRFDKHNKELNDFIKIEFGHRLDASLAIGL